MKVLSVVIRKTYGDSTYNNMQILRLKRATHLFKNRMKGISWTERFVGSWKIDILRYPATRYSDDETRHCPQPKFELHFYRVY